MAKRLALTGDHICEWLDYDDKPPAAGQVRVQTEFASGKYGTWATIMDPAAFGGQRLDPAMRIFKPDPAATPVTVSRERPIAFGTSATGVVRDVGEGVTRVKPGDRVAVVNADIREFNTTAQTNVRPLGELDPLLALCAEPAYVAFHCVRESNVRFGETACVVGLGALGLIAVRMARVSGAERVIAIDLSPGRRKLAARYGADLTLDPRDGDVAATVHEATGGAGVDVAIDLSGSTAGLAAAIRCARVGGTVCAAGFHRTDAAGIWLGREFHHNRLTMIVPHGCGFGHPPRDYPRWDESRAYDAIFAMMRSGRLDLPGLVDPVVGREQAVNLFRQMRDEPDRIAKFAVRFGG
jgi:threonine dehydrogenase-like Zn-dependent dehydrogenase